MATDMNSPVNTRLVAGLTFRNGIKTISASYLVKVPPPGKGFHLVARCECKQCRTRLEVPVAQLFDGYACPECNKPKAKPISQSGRVSFAVKGADGSYYPSRRAWAKALGISIYRATQALDPESSTSAIINGIEYRRAD